LSDAHHDLVSRDDRGGRDEELILGGGVGHDGRNRGCPWRDGSRERSEGSLLNTRRLMVDLELGTDIRELVGFDQLNGTRRYS